MPVVPVTNSMSVARIEVLRHQYFLSPLTLWPRCPLLPCRPSGCFGRCSGCGILVGERLGFRIPVSVFGRSFVVCRLSCKLAEYPVWRLLPRLQLNGFGRSSPCLALGTLYCHCHRLGNALEKHQISPWIVSWQDRSGVLVLLNGVPCYGLVGRLLRGLVCCHCPVWHHCTRIPSLGLGQLDGIFLCVYCLMALKALECERLKLLGELVLVFASCLSEGCREYSSVGLATTISALSILSVLGFLGGWRGSAWSGRRSPWPYQNLQPFGEVPWSTCRGRHAAAVRHLCTSVLSLLRGKPGGRLLY